MVTENDVIEALHGVEDPELGMDIVEIGLFYEAEIDGSSVKIIHSLTSMGCPAGPMIQEGIHDAVAALPGVEHVEVELTFDPSGRPTACRTTPSSSSASGRAAPVHSRRPRNGLRSGERAEQC